jgi:hypothetical protein
MNFLKELVGVNRTTYVVSEKPYEVLDDDFSKERAEFLHRLENWAHEFLEAVNSAWPSDPRLRRIRSRWNGRLNEVIDADDAAFSRGKKSIFVCVWDKRTQRLESARNARYILLHELAHVANETYGHDDAFWKCFAAILEMAEEVGYYDHANHAPEQTFCGHRIGRSPAACRFEGGSEGPGTFKERCESFI